MDIWNRNSSIVNISKKSISGIFFFFSLVHEKAKIFLLNILSLYGDIGKK